MKRKLIFLVLFLVFFLIKPIAQVGNTLNYYLYNENNLRYCNLALRVELQLVFLNGGMCGHKVFKVKEVLKGEYPYEYVRVFMCNNIETRDYVKDIIILSDGKTKDKITTKSECWGGKDSTSSMEITGILCIPDTAILRIPDPQQISPVIFLQFLKNVHYSCFTITQPLRQWVKEEHLKDLIGLLNSKDPAIPVYDYYNGDNRQYTSTVGVEALFLLEGYRTGIYPPDRCSLGPYTRICSEHKNNIEDRKHEMINWLKSKGKYDVK